MSYYDCLVVGAGFAGAVTAGELARRGGKKVLVLERRNHVGGNAYDRLDNAGVLNHQYGPHIFHTNEKRVFDYLSQYTAWNGYQHRVAANLPTENGKDRLQYPVPFNLTSLEIAFGREKAAELETKLTRTYGEGKKVPILELRQSADPALAALADYVYEHVFVHYTMKQWGSRPEDIDPATTARVPEFLSRDDRYFQDTYQGLPTGGYTALFEKILDHPNITVKLGTDVREVLSLGEGKMYVRETGTPVNCPIVYTGAVDEFFDLRYGRLPYRTLTFEFETWRAQGESSGEHVLRVPPFYQTHGTVNFTVDKDYTRITEFKRMTLQELPGATTIVKEYSRPYTGARGEIPYYAILNQSNLALYETYRVEAGNYPNLYLLGRLAEYKYYNMDAIVGQALKLVDQLLGG